MVLAKERHGSALRKDLLVRQQEVCEVEGRGHLRLQILPHRPRIPRLGPLLAALALVGGLELLVGLDDRREVLPKVLAVEEALPVDLLALVKVCEVDQAVLLPRHALTLDDQPQGPRIRPLGRVRDARGQAEDLALAYLHELPLAPLHRRQLHVAVDLVEELAALLQVEVLAGVGPADKHHCELALVHELVADRRCKGGLVLPIPIFYVVQSREPLWHSHALGPWALGRGLRRC
mmetsp:Transcript_126573/g.369856  ORF Transcript_126573/g.369856 Transcript_126573/m.369856 type:complete len:234 (+) Transcript_126573:511-1212(+)